MRIVHLAAEFAPLAKVGGLGEVVVGLSRELSRLHHEVEVIIPKYSFIDIKNLSDVRLEEGDFKCAEKGALHANAMWSGLYEGSRLLLLEARHPSGYFHRGKIYGYPDDVNRFLYFSKACLEYLKLKKQPIDILHLHDWHVATAALLARELFHLPIKKIVLTIHNAAYQGHSATWDLDAIGLEGKNYLTVGKLKEDDPKFPEGINLLKGGVVYADAVVAVSPTYAQEILTPSQGLALHTTFRKHRAKICGILNGIDQKLWDPAKDRALSSPYSQDSSLALIDKGKQSARQELIQRFKFPKEQRPWIGAITRLVPQKGPELLEEGLKETIQARGTFLLLGSSPLPELQSHFEALKQSYASNPSVFLHFEYDEELSHKLYAALDFLLVPSHFEPCGLTQLIAMRYGAIPIVHATGGLKDTVFDVEEPKIPLHQRNGFVFNRPTSQAFKKTLHRAITFFRNEREACQMLMQRNMKINSGWKLPAQAYLQVYGK